MISPISDPITPSAHYNLKILAFKTLVFYNPKSLKITNRPLVVFLALVLWFLVYLGHQLL